MSRVAPTSTGPKRESHTSEMPVHQPKALDDGALLGSREPEQIEVVRDAYFDFGDYAKELAFMEEDVLIQLDRPREKFAPKVLDFYVNGQACWIPVGVPWTVKRKFVEVIARACPYDIRTEVQDETGERPNNVVHRYNETKFPFSVLKDTDRGHHWLAKLRTETV